MVVLLTLAYIVSYLDRSILGALVTPIKADLLLSDVWGSRYTGGTRTVDVHVRRLRAKLGSEYEAMIGTVRQVGYKFVVPPGGRPLPD